MPVMSEYKIQKEAFVSDNLGASLTSINLTSLTALTSCVLYAAISHRFPSNPILDYVVCILPLLLGTTLCATRPILLNSLVLSIALTLYFGKRSGGNDVKSPSVRRGSELRERIPFLSIYRAHMMIMTVICILAVDFQVFPRWQGKCENFGTSLMDVGVGSFVFSLGIVSTKSLSKASGVSSNFLSRTIKSLRKSAPTLLLGFIRVLMVKGTDYPEHVTEYGVHWNFFFTMALLPVFGDILSMLRPEWLGWNILGLGVTMLHQAVLQSGLQDYVLSPHRRDVIEQNKEGLVSLPGYLAIYILGVSCGDHIQRYSTDSAPANDKDDGKLRRRKQGKKLLIQFAFYGFLYWVGLVVLQAVDIDVSRRLSNLPYTLWIAAYNNTFLLGYLAIQMLFSLEDPTYSAVPPLLDAFNRNGLVGFLIANLLTGLINISIQTMHAGIGVSMAVMVLYTGVVSSVAWYGRKHTIRL